MRQAWRNPDANEAIRDLEALAGQLDKLNPDAAGSLREGLAEMFTITRLGVTGALLKTVFSTNPVESMIEIVRWHARNVKRWQPRRHAPALGRRRHVVRRRAVPQGQGLPPAPTPRRGAPTSDRRAEVDDQRVLVTASA